MNKARSICLLFLSLVISVKVTGQNTFQKTIHFPADFIEKGPSNEFMLFGSSNSALGAVKYDKWGNFQWGKNIYESGGLTLYNTERSRFRNCHLLSCISSLGKPTYIRMDSTGNLSGIRFLPSINSGVSLMSFHEDKNKNMYMVMSQDYDMWFSDAVIIKTDSAYSIQWGTQIDLPDINGETHPTASCLTADGSVLVTGMVMNSFFIIKISDQGQKVWERYYFPNDLNTCGSLIPISILETQSKEIVIGGSGHEPISGYNPAVIKLDSTGTILYAKSVRDPGFQGSHYEGIIEANNGDLVLKSRKAIGDTSYLARLTPGGSIVSGKKSWNTLTWGPRKVIVEDNNTDLMILYTNQTQDRVLHRTDLMGNGNCNIQNATLSAINIPTTPWNVQFPTLPIVLSSTILSLTETILTVSDSTMCIPTSNMDEQNSVPLKFYPNPATDKIYFSAEEGLTSFELIDSKGRVVQSEHSSTNLNHLIIDKTGSGIYFYRATFRNGAVTSGKIIIE